MNYDKTYKQGVIYHAPTNYIGSLSISAKLNPSEVF